MFDGGTYNDRKDRTRLKSQLDRVFYLMKDGKYRTLDEIQGEVGGSVPAVSARLRDLRKKKFGGFIVERKRRIGQNGLFEYRLIVRKEVKEPEQIEIFA